MVATLLPLGLIASTRMSVSPQLDDLVACCGWPLLLEATPRLLAHELSNLDPACVLFWLEEQRDVVPTTRLMAWLRLRGARPYRVAAARCMECGVEAALRAAGAHTFLAVAHLSADDVLDALWPLWTESGDRVATAVRHSDLARPP